MPSASMTPIAARRKRHRSPVGFARCAAQGLRELIGRGIEPLDDTAKNPEAAEVGSFAVELDAIPDITQSCVDLALPQ